MMATGVWASGGVGLVQERLSTLEASSGTGMQNSQVQRLDYGQAVIHLDITVEAGRDEVEALRWSLTSIGEDPDALS